MTKKDTNTDPWMPLDEVHLQWYEMTSMPFQRNGDYNHGAWRAKITGGPKVYKLKISRGWSGQLHRQGFDGTLIPEWEFPSLEEAKAHAKAWLAHKGVTLE